MAVKKKKKFSRGQNLKDSIEEANRGEGKRRPKKNPNFSPQPIASMRG